MPILDTMFNPKNDDYVIKIRGIPWSSTVDEILDFFEECHIKDEKKGIHLTKCVNGRPSGEAYIQLECEDDFNKALKKDRKHMGCRYIEVFKSSKCEMDFVVKRCGLYIDNVVDEACIRLRGLPFECTKDDIIQFFEGLEFDENGITFVRDDTDRSTGDAFVQFINKESVEKALEKHMHKIGHRYVEVFRSSLAELCSQTGPKMKQSSHSSCGRCVPYDRSERHINKINSSRPLLYHKDQRVNFGDRKLWNSNTSNKTNLKCTSADCSIIDNSNKIVNSKSSKSDGTIHPVDNLSIADVGKNSLNTDTVAIHYSTNLTNVTIEQFQENHNSSVDYEIIKNCVIGTREDTTTTIKVDNEPSKDNRYSVKPINPARKCQDSISNGFSVLVDRINLSNVKSNIRSAPYAISKTNEPAHMVHMRGLPYKVTIDDIIKFFHPFTPNKVHLIYDKFGRLCGEADIEFLTHEEAVEAMIKDKQHIKTRYIELFLNSTPKCFKTLGKSKAKKNGKQTSFVLESENRKCLCVDDNSVKTNENNSNHKPLPNEIENPRKITLLQRSVLSVTDQRSDQRK